MMRSCRMAGLVVLAAIVAGISAAAPAGAVHLVKKWATDPLFDVPESVCWDTEREILYVSNISGSPADRDSTGFISRVTIEGDVKKLRWITGLNAPKGMAVFEGRLYVSDIDELAVIEIKTDRIVEKYPADGAVFLNDVAVDGDGNVYVSDSSRENSAIYRLSGGSLKLWLHGKPIQSPNGLCVDGDRLIVGNSGDATLKAVDLGSGEITTAVNVGSAIDGLRIDKRGNFIVSDWKGRTVLIEPDGGIYVLLDTRSEKINAADLEFVAEFGMVVIPTFYDNRIVAAELRY
jgi:DNA-binding beta-propeller fold protein YncE